MDRENVIKGLIEIINFFDIMSTIENRCNELKQDAENAIVLLKEQEPIEPRNTYLTTPSGKIIPHIFCGKCNKEIYVIYAFCPYCGQAVKWNE